MHLFPTKTKTHRPVTIIKFAFIKACCLKGAYSLSHLGEGGGRRREYHAVFDMVCAAGPAFSAAVRVGAIINRLTTRVDYLGLRLTASLQVVCTREAAVSHLTSWQENKQPIHSGPASGVHRYKRLLPKRKPLVSAVKTTSPLPPGWLS